MVTLAAALRYAHPVNEVVGRLQTPSTHAIRTRSPDGTETSNASAAISVGRVAYDLTIADAAASEGRWFFKPAGTAGVLATDEHARVGWTGALAPMASGYRPLAVTLGVLGLYAGLAAGLTAALAGRMAGRIWLPIHRVAGVSLVLVWAHSVLAGTDTPALFCDSSTSSLRSIPCSRARGSRRN